MIGSIGGIVFETSIEKVRTFNDMTRKGSVEYAEHPIHGNKSRLEFVKHNLDEISFSCRLDVSLGINPRVEITKFREKMNRAEVVDLLLGEDYKGAFVITGIDEAWKQVDKHGNILVAEISVSIREHVSWNTI